MRRVVMKKEVLRRRRFTYEYEGVLARCGAYLERVCRRVLFLRHFAEVRDNVLRFANMRENRPQWRATVRLVELTSDRAMRAGVERRVGEADRGENQPGLRHSRHYRLTGRADDGAINGRAVRALNTGKPSRPDLIQYAH